MSLPTQHNITSVDAACTQTKYKSENKKIALYSFLLMLITASRVLMMHARTHAMHLAACVIDGEAARSRLVAS